ncbi:hypothetical protein KKF84_17950, partial [Myxococcota bacterium]|nr:hypothetical protein [Myxococcota bacterium]MBU1537205.1 hypothetical protein [Myxococcota bacterium]
DRIDHQSDIYSLGAMLYEILTGKPPLTGGTVHQLLMRVVSESVPPVRERAPEAPAELAAIAEKALAKEKSGRYVSCGELSADLSAWLSGEKVSTYSYSNWELLARFVRRNRALVAAVGVVLMALVATVVFTTRAWKQESRALSQTRAARDREVLARREAQRQKAATQLALDLKILQERRARYQLAQAYLARAELLFTQRYYLDAQVFAAASALFHPGNPRSEHYHSGFCGKDVECMALTAKVHGLLLMSRTRAAYVYRSAVTTQKPMNLRKTMYDMALMSISPDGRHFIPLLRGRSVHVREVASGREVLALTGHAAPVAQVTFDASGTGIVSIDDAGEVMIWSFPSGKLRSRLPTGMRGCFVAQGMPGTTGVILADRGGTLLRLDTAAGSFTRLAPPHTGSMENVVVSPSGRYLLLQSRGPLQVHDLSTGRWHLLSRRAGRGTMAAFTGRSEHLVVQFPVANEIVTFIPPDWSRGASRQMLADDGGESYTNLLPSSLPDDTVLGRSSYFQIHLLRSTDLKILQRFNYWGGLSQVYTSRSGIHILSSEREILTYERFGFLERLSMATLDGTVGLIQPLGDRYTVLGSWKGTARLWDARTGYSRLVGEKRKGFMWCAALSPDERTLALGSFDGAVQLLDFPSGTLRKVLPTGNQVSWLKFSTDNKSLHVATFRGLRTVDLASYKSSGEISIFPAFGNGPSVDAHPTKLLWHDPGRSGKQQVYRIHDITTGKTTDLAIDDSSVYRFNAMLLRDDYFVTQGFDNCLNLRRLPSTKVIHRYCGFAATVSTVSVNTKADLLVASADDHTVRLWRLSTGRPILVIPTIMGQVAALSPDGKYLMIEVGYHALRLPLELSVLKLSAADLLKKAEASAGLCLEGTRLVPLPRCRRP